MIAWPSPCVRVISPITEIRPITPVRLGFGAIHGARAARLMERVDPRTCGSGHRQLDLVTVRGTGHEGQTSRPGAVCPQPVDNDLIPLCSLTTVAGLVWFVHWKACTSG
nr:hypothetical protein KPHV_43670 [Kitasatospora purpeofusca]